MLGCATIGSLQLTAFPRIRVTTVAQNRCYSITTHTTNKQRNPVHPVSSDAKGVKASTSCGRWLPGVPSLPPLQLPQAASRGGGG